MLTYFNRTAFIKLPKTLENSGIDFSAFYQDNFIYSKQTCIPEIFGSMFHPDHKFEFLVQATSSLPTFNIWNALILKIWNKNPKVIHMHEIMIIADSLKVISLNLWQLSMHKLTHARSIFVTCPTKKMSDFYKPVEQNNR